MFRGDGSSLFFYAPAVGHSDDKQIREFRQTPSVGSAHTERQPRRFSMSSFRLLLLSMPLLVCAGVAAAAEPADPLPDCVDLGANHEAFRYANQALLVADGDAHYKISFGVGGCEALMAASTVDIATDGQANRLCPNGSRVSARAKSCAVSKVSRISADRYVAYQRKARSR